MKVVLDTCILKLATFPADDNPSALIAVLGLHGLFEWWASPAILDEYSYVLADEPEWLAEVFQRLAICYPLTRLNIIRHEPDNRFIECAFAVDAHFLITVNTATGHFDRQKYGNCRVATPRNFLNTPSVQPLLRRVTI